MRYTAEQFRKEKNKRLTLLGMSGVGKTHLSKLLSKEGRLVSLFWRLSDKARHT